MRRSIGIAAALLAACGGTAASNNTGSHSCSVTLSAVTGTYDCLAPTAGWDSGKNTGAIGAASSATGTVTITATFQ